MSPLGRGWPPSVRVSSDTSHVAAGLSNGEVKVWTVATDKITGKVEHLVRAFELRAHRGPVLGLAFHWNNRRLITVGRDKAWHVWNWDGTHEALLSDCTIARVRLLTPPPLRSRGEAGRTTVDAGQIVGASATRCGPPWTGRCRSCRWRWRSRRTVAPLLLPASAAWWCTTWSVRLRA